MAELKLLDTSVVIGLLRGDNEIERMVRKEENTLCTCFPVECELYRGTRLAARTEEGEKEVEALLNQLETLEADRESAKKMAELKGEYPEINSFDLMIAGICIKHGATLITKDSDFQQIDEIDVKQPE